MTLFQGLGASPSETAESFGNVLSLFGAVGDYALGNPPDHGARIGSLGCAIAELGGSAPQECATIQIAGVLHAIGALGNRGVRKGDALAPRAAQMERWNIPATGASLCEQIPGLPNDTGDTVRWHAEAWDGTGYPDQLRWHGIPKAAQYLHLAELFVEGGEPEDALSAIHESSGRIFSPEAVRTFVMWFHTYGGEIELRDFPFGTLQPEQTSASTALRLLSEAIDSHNGTPGRASRMKQRANATAAILKLSATEQAHLEIAALTFGAGELMQPELEWHRFDPLASLGRAARAKNAAASAGLLAPLTAFEPVAQVLRARAEWFDGTGLPDNLAGNLIPIASRILAVCIAHDALDEAHRTHIREDRTPPLQRLQSAAGKQFDPAVVHAYAQALKAAT